MVAIALPSVNTPNCVCVSGCLDKLFFDGGGGLYHLSVYAAERFQFEFVGALHTWNRQAVP